MKKIRIAQIGTSRYSHGNSIWNSIVKQSDLFDVVGFAMPEDEKTKFHEQMKVFDGFREMTVDEILRDSTIEAVTVETEEPFLTDYALQAAKHGKHIHMEKPGGCDLAAFEELVKTVKANRTVFNLGYMYRYNPYILDLMEQIRKGTLGEIYSVEAQMSCSEPQDLRQWLGNFSGGMMFFLGCHLVDLVLRIQGIPNRIIPLNRKTGIDGIPATDYGMAVFEYGNGISFVKTSAVELGGFERRQLVISGSKGTVELQPLEWYDGENLRTQKRTGFSENWYAHGEKQWSDGYDRYDAMMAAFAAYIRGDAITPYPPDYELTLYQTLLKCCE